MKSDLSTTESCSAEQTSRSVSSAPIQYRNVAARDLTAEQLAAWAEIQAADGTLDSAFFRPEFTQAVAAVRDDVEVAVMEQEDRPVGFLPFQRGSRNVGHPVGGRLSDFQGVIARPGLDWNAEQLIRGSGLSAWHFDHLLETQQPLADCHFDQDGSPYMDLSKGFESYRAAQKKSGSQLLSQTLRKSRKIAREVGPIRMELHEPQSETFNHLLEWKTEQYRRTKVPNVLSAHWIVDLLKEIQTIQNESFGGVLTAMYAGDHLAAVHLGMRSRNVYHIWFPTYNREFSKYSPGLVLLLELAKAAETWGFKQIDLGKGEESYKTSFMSGNIVVAEGSVDTRYLARTIRQRVLRMKRFIRSSRVRCLARIPWRATRHIRQWLSFR